MATIKLHRAHFFNKPTSGGLTNAQMRDNFRIHIYGKNVYDDDSSYFTTVRSAANNRVFLYLTIDNADNGTSSDPATPGGSRNRGNILFNQLDLQTAHSTFSDGFWLHNTDESILYHLQGNGRYDLYFNVSNADVQELYRQKLLVDTNYLGSPAGMASFVQQFDGVWFDNMKTFFGAQTVNPVDTLEYGSGLSDEWWDDQLTFIEYIKGIFNGKNGWHGEPLQVWGNAQGGEGTKEFARLKQMCQTFHGFTQEFGAGLDSGGGFQGTVDYANRLAQLVVAQSEGAHTLCVIPVANASINESQWDTTSTEAYKLSYALATCMLAIGDPERFAIRVGGQSSYGNASLFTTTIERFEKLGAPTGRYTRSGDTYTRTFRNGSVSVNASAQTFTLTITDDERSPTNEYPVITQIPDQYGKVEDLINLQVYASDPEGATLTYSATGLPSGLRINPATGLISGTLLSTDYAFKNSVTISVSDGTNESDTTFVFWVYTGAIVERINCAGAVQTALDSGNIDWRADSAAAPYPSISDPANRTVNSISAQASDGSYPGDIMPVSCLRDVHFKSGTPYPVFNVGSVVTLANGDYRIHIYIGRGTDGTTTRNMRFVVNGSNAIQNINPGTLIDTENVATLLTHDLTISDGVLGIGMVRQTESGGAARDFAFEVVLKVARANNAPVLAAVGNKAGNAGSLLQFTVSAEDVDGAWVSLSGEGTALDEGATLTDNYDGTATVRWINPPQGEYTLNIVASDGLATDDESITIDIGEAVVVSADRPRWKRFPPRPTRVFRGRR